MNKKRCGKGNRMNPNIAILAIGDESVDWNKIHTRDSGTDKGFERRCFEVRKFDDTDGTFEAYVAVWGDVDSYGTRFTRGAFRKSIQERLKAGNIKILWQHNIKEPIGIVKDAREDDHGLLVNGKLDIGVERADQARTQMLSGTINQMSFGFDIVKQKRATDGFIDISEVKLWEVSPVTFGANENTSVVNVRSRFEQAEHEEDTDPENNNEPEEAGEESRSTDFNETLQDMEFWQKGSQIMNSFYYTMDDVWYSDLSPDDKIAAMDDTWEKAHAAYVEWMSAYLTRGFHPIKNELSAAFEKTYGDKTIEDIALNSPLSADELRSLKAGELISVEARTRLAEFSPEISSVYREVRGKAVTSLFQQLRDKGTFSEAELARIRVLAGSTETRCNCGCNGDKGASPTDMAALLESLDSLSNVIKTKGSNI